MERHSQNGKLIAEYLKTNSNVEKVFWPGFEDHPNYEIARNQMRDFGGMVSILVNGGESAARRACEKFKLFFLAESLGGVESLSNHPAIMTHASVPSEEREKIGIADNMIRLSVGIEDPEDLIEDLSQALS